MSERIIAASGEILSNQVSHSHPTSVITCVPRPTSLSGLQLDETQDVSKILKELHSATPPAPPPVDRSKKPTPTDRKLRTRSESLNYKEVNQGKQFPSWRFQL